MNADRLLAEFERLAEVSDAVPRLRRFILDLAVRGKLVEQDPRDEPSGKLLERMSVERTRLLANGTIRAVRTSGEDAADERAFEVPANWAWCRLSDVGAVIGGGTPPSGEADNFTTGGSGIPWLTPADLGKSKDLYVRHGARDLTAKGLSSSSATLMPTGSVLFTSRAPIGYVAIAANEVSTNQGFKSVVPYIAEGSLYVAVYFRAFAGWIDRKASGTTFREVSGRIVSNLPFPLPPLAEQHRIVAKVDELMALCDRLEAAQRASESGRDRLVTASLHRLSEAPDATGVRRGAVFYLSHFQVLSTRAGHVAELRRSILHLAVKGRLVRQNPRDESSSELLRRIVEDRESAVNDRTWRRRSSVEPVGDSLDLSSVPMGWNVVRAAEILTFITSGSRGWAAYYSREGAIFLRIGNLDYGTTAIDLSDIQHVSPPSGAECERTRVNAGDILVSITGDTGMVGLVPPAFPQAYINQHIALLRPSPRICQQYLAMFFSSPPALLQLRASQRGIKNSLGLEDIRNVRIPLPPEAEQHRIVAKIDELMVICDHLETQIVSGGAGRAGLLEAVLHESLEKVS